MSKISIGYENQKDITIKEVAKYAGVAISTVSRVVNGLDRVSEETRQAVFNAIDVLEYKPNITAKTLKAKRSEAVGFICEDISSPFVPEVIRGIEHTARDSGFSVILCNSDWDHNNTILHLNMLQTRNIDGIIYSTPMKIEDPLLSKLIRIREQIPVVLISEDNLDDGFNRIDIEVEEGMNLLLQHLFSLGHTRVSLIAGPEDSGTNAIKIAYYSSIMKSKGLSEFIHYEYTDLSMQQGIVAANKLLHNKGKEHPTAIIGASDLNIIGALQAVKNMGLKVPEDISLIGWGGIKYGLYTDPPITTINVPRNELGKKAIDMLFTCIQNKTASCKQVNSITLPVELEIRGSTGPYVLRS